MPKYAKIGHKGLNKQKTKKKKKTKKTKKKQKKTKTKKTKISRDCRHWGHVFGFFVFFVFFVFFGFFVFFVFFCSFLFFFVFLLFLLFFLVFSGPKGRMQRVESFHAPREGCRELSLVICFSSCQSMHMSKQRMCKEECKRRTLTVPCSGERGTVRVRFLFTDVASRYHIYIYASDVAARSHLYDRYTYIYIYAHLRKFIQLGHKKQNILHMHSEKLNNAINGFMSFSQ